MAERTDHELLAEFAGSESEEAFAALVSRYVNLVYSTALRFTGNAHHAEEITQAVFIILARKAGALSPRAVLSGWLYQTARLTAANFVKGEMRRQRREQEAYMQSTLNEPDTAAWEQIAPLLDDAMGRLGETERNAVVLSFFENKTAAEVGAALQLSEAAAHKRTSRALEKLRKFLSNRGVSSTTAILGGAISGHSVHTAPAALVKSVTAIALAKGAASASTLTLIQGALKTMAWTKAKTTTMTAAAAVAAIIVGTATFTWFHNPHPSQPGRLKLPAGDVPPVISFGRSHGVILAPDGSLWSWGENDLGWSELGLGNVKKTAYLNRIGTNTDWVGIAASFAHNLALRKDGTIWGWGENTRDDLGTHPAYLFHPGRINAANDDATVPVKSALGNGWQQIAAGMEDSFGMKTDGTLWAWGLNNFGQLGIGSFSNQPGPIQIGSNTWKEVRAGFVNGAGIQSDGSLWVWGGGPSVGNTAPLKADDYSSPVRVSEETNWMDVAVGNNVVFALNSEGALWAWGYDAWIFTGSHDGSTLTRIGTDSDWEKVSCCGSHYLMLAKRDGSLWSMSPPDFGKPAKLNRVELQKNIIAIGGGGGLGVALTRDGEVWTWGKTIGEDVMRFEGSGKNSRTIDPKFHVFNQPWQLSNKEP